MEKENLKREKLKLSMSVSLSTNISQMESEWAILKLVISVKIIFVITRTSSDRKTAFFSFYVYTNLQPLSMSFHKKVFKLQ